MQAEFSSENVSSCSEFSFSLPYSSGSHSYATPAIFSRPQTPFHAAVILCHGFLSNKESRTNRRLTELLIPQGIATLGFDWHGMGQSSEPLATIGIQKCLNQLDAAFHWLQEKNISQIGLMGSSFGGLMALLFSPQRSDLAALALKCPVVDFPEVLQGEFGKTGMEEWKQTNHIPDILGGTSPIPLDYAFFEECLDFVGYSAAQQIQVPTLIVHGQKDDLIPRHQIDRLVASFPKNKRLDLLPEADHRFGRPEDFRIMTNRISQWMVDHLHP